MFGIINWKTTLGAVMGLVTVGSKAYNHFVNGGPALETEDYALLATSLGLLFAKDHNVTGGTTSQAGGTVPESRTERDDAAGEKP